ncbi:MAG: beta-ketoacyl synthase N-terminal-like domain-containing protein [Candidatus Methylomirabilia bacterium]
MNIFVTGVGWAGAAGMGTGRGPTPFALPPGELPPISRHEIFPDADSRFGRLDAFSRLALAGVALALRDAGIEKWTQPRAAAIAASTTYGCTGTDLEYLATLGEAPGLASPQLFAYTLPNVFLGEAAIRFGLTGPTVIVSDEEGTGAAALETALDYVAGGGGAALAGICDLARPARLPARPEPPPGALFLVLERRPTLEPLGSLGVPGRRQGNLDDTHDIRALAGRLCGKIRRSC